MIKDNLRQIEKLSGGYGLLEEYLDLTISGVSIDSRTLRERRLYIPIIGENFNGHTFLGEAVHRGAIASIWQKDIPAPNVDFPFIYVEDTLVALQTLARNYRDSLKKLKVIGITGSNGKTATKDILDGILSHKYKTKKTIGNLNNHIGLPLTLLSLNKNTKFAILEMGTDGQNQIEFLTNMAKPDMAIITNVGASHLDLLKTEENVAHAKLEILEGIKDSGYFIYNNDDEVLLKAMEQYDINVNKISFGKKDGSDFKIELLKQGLDGVYFNITEEGKTHKIHIPMIGPHNMYNAAASIVVARKLSMDYEDIQEGLYNIEETGMRNEIIEKENFTILNDAYKSNPSSLLAALDTLYSIDGYKSKSIVLGDMLDLGEDVVRLHEEIGTKIDKNKVDKIFTLGKLAKHIGDSAKVNFNKKNIFHSETKEELIKSIKENIGKDTLLLIKGSRSVGLEDIIDEL